MTKLLGYADGDYHCKCDTCGAEFSGDKRAFLCLPCAIKEAENSVSSLMAGLFSKCKDRSEDYSCTKGCKFTKWCYASISIIPREGD